MATDLERLIVSLEARTVAYERALNKAMGVTNTRMRQMERRAKQAGVNVGAALTRGLQLVGGAAAIRGFQRLIDAGTRVENSLKVAGLAGEELTQVYDRLFQSAQRNAAPLESLVELYSRASLVQKELGITTEELLRFTDQVAVALRVSGQSAAESSGALLQLSQALGSGIVRAEEFNSILEGALPIAQAAAAGLDEAGGSVAKLRQLVVDGKVSSEAFFRAFEAGSGVLQEKVAGAVLTTDQQLQTLQNTLVDAAGKFNDATGASEGFASMLGALNNAIAETGTFFEQNMEPIRGFIALMGQAVSLLQYVPFVNPNAPIQQGMDAYRGVFGGVVDGSFSQLGGGGNDALQEALNRVAADRGGGGRVSLDDFASPGGDTKGRDAAAKAAERQAQAVRGLIADLEFEMSLFGRSKLEQEQMIALRQAGAAATDEQRERIRELVTATFQQAEALQRMQEITEGARDAMHGFISDLVAGKSAAEALGNVLANVGDRLLGLGLDALFGGGASGGTGLIGQALGFRANGGPVTAGQPYIVGERGPELMVPSQSGTIIPRVPTGGASITYAPQIDARGADMAAVARLEQVIARDRAEFDVRVRHIVSRRGKMGW